METCEEVDDKGCFWICQNDASTSASNIKGTNLCPCPRVCYQHTSCSKDVLACTVGKEGFTGMCCLTISPNRLNASGSTCECNCRLCYRKVCQYFKFWLQMHL